MNKSLVEIKASYDEPEYDLDWLARNVHEWPTESLFASHGIMLKDDRIVAIFRQYEDQTTSDVTYSKDEWLTRRAELQNKPSWDSHNWPNIFQNENGHWFGVMDGWDFKEHISNESKGPQVNMLRAHGEFLRHGKIIGDWRNTFEKRPESSTGQKEDAEKAMDLLKNLPMHNGELSNKAVEFCQSIGATWDHGLREWVIVGPVKQEWSGPEDGLPPAGTACEAYDHGSSKWVEGVVLMHGNSDHAFASGKPEHWKKLFWANKFRPIRSDHDKWVESCTDIIRCTNVMIPGMHQKEIAEALYYALLSGALLIPGGAK